MLHFSFMFKEVQLRLRHAWHANRHRLHVPFMILNHLYSSVVCFVDVLGDFHQVTLADLLQLLVAESEVIESSQFAHVFIRWCDDYRLVRFL